MPRRRKSSLAATPADPMAAWSLAMSSWSLAMDATMVAALRMDRIARGGPAGQAEAKRMVDEKIETGLAWQAMALTGKLGADPAVAAGRTVKLYSRKVRANRRRLGGG